MADVRAAYLHDRTVETLGLLFDMHWPARQFATARRARRSPFHDRLAAQGAWMSEAGGWKSPGSFRAPGETADVTYSYGRPSWFEQVGEECRHTAEAVTHFHQTCFVKYCVEGRHALEVLEKVLANCIDVAVGRVIYIQ